MKQNLKRFVGKDETVSSSNGPRMEESKYVYSEYGDY